MKGLLKTDCIYLIPQDYISNYGLKNSSLQRKNSQTLQFGFASMLFHTNIRIWKSYKALVTFWVPLSKLLNPPSESDTPIILVFVSISMFQNPFQPPYSLGFKTLIGSKPLIMSTFPSDVENSFLVDIFLGSSL
jgi:hypothetical protein